MMRLAKVVKVYDAAIIVEQELIKSWSNQPQDSWRRTGRSQFQGHGSSRRSSPKNSFGSDGLSGNKHRYNTCGKYHCGKWYMCQPLVEFTRELDIQLKVVLPEVEI